MEIKTEKLLCSGCGACEAACTQNAVTMIADKEGFLYPVIDQSLCINCGRCNAVCPVQKPSIARHVQTAYAVRHTDPDVLSKSTSGGMFTALSDAILAKDGVVYGAAFDEEMVVRHIRATSSVDRDRMRGSKYVQSDLQGCYKNIREDLKQGKTVLFAGTPCQVEGLRCFLGEKTEGLICCDLICHGTPSPLILKEHFSLLSSKIRSRLSNYYFRPKRWGWKIHREIAEFENGYELFGSPYSDLWREIYYRRLVHRPSCHRCRYCNLSRPGDLSIGDCRGIEKVSSEFDSYDGVSLVLVNTPLGVQILKEVSQSLIMQEIGINNIMQPPLMKPSKPGNARDLFWETYHKKGYLSAVHKCFGRLYSLKYWVKKIIGRK